MFNLKLASKCFVQLLLFPETDIWSTFSFLHGVSCVFDVCSIKSDLAISSLGPLLAVYVPKPLLTGSLKPSLAEPIVSQVKMKNSDGSCWSMAIKLMALFYILGRGRIQDIAGWSVNSLVWGNVNSCVREPSVTSCFCVSSILSSPSWEMWREKDESQTLFSTVHDNDLLNVTDVFCQSRESRTIKAMCQCHQPLRCLIRVTISQHSQSLKWLNTTLDLLHQENNSWDLRWLVTVNLS